MISLRSDMCPGWEFGFCSVIGYHECIQLGSASDLQASPNPSDRTLHRGGLHLNAFPLRRTPHVSRGLYGPLGAKHGACQPAPAGLCAGNRHEQVKPYEARDGRKPYLEVELHAAHQPPGLMGECRGMRLKEDSGHGWNYGRLK